MKLAAVIFAFATVVSPFAYSATCALSGTANFNAVPSDSAYPNFGRLEFRQVSNNVLAIRYCQDLTPGAGHQTPYIIDGVSHAGDQTFSGDSYTAVCDSTHLTVTITDHHINMPLIYEFDVSGPGASILLMNEKLGGSVRTNLYTRDL